MKIEKFNEVNINLDQLNKTINGELRGDVLVNKLKDGEEFTFKKGGRGEPNVAPIDNTDYIIPNITTGDSYDSDKAAEFFKQGSRFKKVIIADNDGEQELYQLNDIVKTEEFGSSSGTSLGFKSTRDVECIQCLFLALRQSFGNEPITEDNYVELYDDDGNVRADLLVSIRVPIKITASLLESYESWLETFITTANALYDVRPVYSKDKKGSEGSILSMSKDYLFFQIGYADSGELIDVLIKKYRDDFKSITRGIPISKWTPSDVWACEVDNYEQVISELEECENIEDFNMVVNHYFRLKVLRGISLKKVKKIEDIEIIYNRITPVPMYSFKHVITSIDPLCSLGVKVIAHRESDYISQNVGGGQSTDEILDVRSFRGNSLSDINCEIWGVKARGGKIGLTRINHILKSLGLETIPTKAELLSDWDKDELLDVLVGQLPELSRYGNKIATRVAPSTTLPRVLSKWQALKLTEILYTLDEYDANNLIQKIFLYAMSVSNDQFECPSYVRII